jgi:DNA-directed RNA polymerase subunit N (RpoN/RPB10)
MIIPIKCMSCGFVLADKYRCFKDEVRKMKKMSFDLDQDKYSYKSNISYFTKTNVKKTPEGLVLDNLKINNMCCRRHMLTHVDIE